MIYEPKGRAKEYAELACNIYHGCDHGCTYCFAPSVLHIAQEDFHASVAPRGSLIDIEADAGRFFVEGFRDPVLLCFTCDPYSPGAFAYDPWTRQCIEAIHRGGLPVTILTKGGMRALSDVDILTDRDTLATTLTLLQTDALQYEPHAAPTTQRISMLRVAKKLGIRTWASFEPVIDAQQTLALIREAAPYLDMAKIGKLNYGPTPKPIDWCEFGRQAEELCQELGLAYYLKRDLREAMMGDMHE